MRPRSITEFIGQQHLLAEGKPLCNAIANKTLHSMILWGPPGCGKTTLAKLLATNATAHMEQLSAVLAGVKEIRAVVEHAQYRSEKTVLFVDEVHRFNKAQQDAFLPYVEDGTITLIGATTENPSFALNNALLSRARVYVLTALQHHDLHTLIDHVLIDEARGLGKLQLHIDDNVRDNIIHYADGDARALLNILDIASDFAMELDGRNTLTLDAIKAILSAKVNRFDKGGDLYYEQISALHKAVRGSSPDGALYWLSRMLTGGCDPNYIARRIVRMASEDIGNADPRALPLCIAAWQTYERVGSPEGEIALAQAVTYLASCPKSNAVYTAFNAAWQDANNSGSLEVPMHLRNASTSLMKELGYGHGYRYDPDQAEGISYGQRYFPEQLGEKIYYAPKNEGLEIKIKAKLDALRK
ncbi:MAG: replication-associated recombination protein A [Coxiellaceae bacterium]|nr:replication-associated recombination protein A [Coxiellaceae bacterium]